MTITSFGEYPEPVNEGAIKEATTRWESNSEVFSECERKKTIAKIALGIIAAWGAVAGAIILAAKTDGDFSTLCIVLSCVSGVMAPILTCALYSLANNLRTYKPYKYDLDNPKTVQRVRQLLTDGSIKQVSSELENYCAYLQKAGILTEENCRDVNEYISRYTKFSGDMGWFHLSHKSTEIAESEKFKELSTRELLLKNEWESYQTDHLPNNLPMPTVRPTERTPLNEV